MGRWSYRVGLNVVAGWSWMRVIFALWFRLLVHVGNKLPVSMVIALHESLFQKAGQTVHRERAEGVEDALAGHVVPIMDSVAIRKPVTGNRMLLAARQVAGAGAIIDRKKQVPVKATRVSLIR